MKNTFNKSRNLFLIVAIFLTSSYSFSQKLQFRDITLSILQSIPYTTTYSDIIALGESKKIELTKKTNKDKTESLNFKMGARDITILYSKDKKFIYAMTTADQESEDYKTTQQLTENNFERTHNMKTKGDAFGDVTWYYNKVSYPYEFAIYVPVYGNMNDVYIFNKEFGSFEKFKQ